MESFPLALMFSLVLFLLAAEVLLAVIVFGCDFLSWITGKILRLFS